MSDIKSCDRCSAHYTLRKWNKKECKQFGHYGIYDWNVPEKEFGKYMDLCDTCRKHLSQFMENER